MKGPSPAASPHRFGAGASRWLRLLRPALLVLSTVAIFFVAMQAMELRSQLQTFREEPVDNIHWNVTQLELDIFHFEAEAEQMVLQPTASLKDLRVRFDLFYSRAQSVLHGRMFLQLGLSDIVAPMNQRLQTFLDTTTVMIDSDDTALRQDLPQLLQHSTALREDLRTMSIELIDKYAALADKRRADFTNLLQKIGWASAALLAVLILLLALVLRLNRQAEANMRQTRRVSSRLAATVDTSLDAIIVADHEGRISDFNSAAVSIFGYSRAEAIGATLADLIIPPHHRDAHANGMDRMLRTGEMCLVNSGRFRITAIRKSGEEFPIEMSLASSEDGDDTLFISYLRDISHSVAGEQAVIAARDKAMAAEQAKTAFMAVMSHEMRTPLNGVMAALEIASRKTVDAKQARFLDIARSSSLQLLRHANEVLDISKIDAGRLALTEEDFDVATLVDTLIGALAQVAAQKNTTISVKALSDLPLLHGDPFRLGQIIQNFLSNAIKFTDEGKIMIEFEVAEQSPQSITLELRVSDTGVGIAEADQERVFEDFVMLDPSYGRSSGGTGLGLAISRRLALAMGGNIGVESDLGQGSCFWLRIPFRLGTARQTALASHIASDPSHRLDILVVEDNATNRIVLEEMLLQLGHRVTLAVDGGEGMVLARAHCFDVILMDVSMPIMDGLTATEMIRYEGLSRTTRIIAVTAHSMPEDRGRFKAAGMDDYLTKPISEADLIRTLARCQPDGVAAGTGKAVLDADRLTEISAAMGVPGLQRAISRTLQDLPVIHLRMQTAAVDGHTTVLQDAAHEAAGACAMIGATGLGQRLALVEDLCRHGDLPGATAMLSGCTDLWHSTEDQLRRHLRH